MTYSNPRLGLPASIPSGRRLARPRPPDLAPRLVSPGPALNDLRQSIPINIGRDRLQNSLALGVMKIDHMKSFLYHCFGF